MSLIGTTGLTGAVIAGLGALTSYATLAPRSQLWCRLISRGRTDRPRVALTFDDGPVAGATDRVLDILAEMNVKATFFVIGCNVERSPELLRRIDSQGHLVGNHSFEHLHWGFARGRGYWVQELQKTNALIEQLIGKRPALFRPPMGIKTWRIASAARRQGQQIITWSRKARDGVITTPDEIVTRLTQDVGPGDILALHDGIDPQRRRNPQPTLDALRRVIDRLKERGLEPVRLDELIQTEPYLKPATILRS
jgi:peptidoglycan-N-acetylglucosamine deacetylase